MTNTYISIDLETTGLNPKTDKIMEIGAVKVEEGRITDTYSSLIQPRRLLEESTTALTGITDAMLEGAPGLELVIGDLVDFCGDLPLLGHHVIFDFSFLKRAAVNHDLKFERSGIDTLTLCRIFMPPEEKKNLTAACAYYQVSMADAHRAAADAAAAHDLYQKLLRLYGGERPEVFEAKPLIYKVKKDQSATKRQKEYLRELLKYHKINLSAQIDYLTRSEASRITDQVIGRYGKYKRGEEQ